MAKPQIVEYRMYSAASGAFRHCVVADAMLSTGLVDSNGVAIYEGDIVVQSFKCTEPKDDETCDADTIEGWTLGRVKIYPSTGACIVGGFRCVNDEEPYPFNNPLKLRGKRSYVIGNFHEHPQFLTADHAAITATNIRQYHKVAA